ncbi:MAG TPA: hypothetical protein VL860_03400, partial [Planctomycetota bacterium]|nr:hypothetical protein [Planctomycetota bacterium]
QPADPGQAGTPFEGEKIFLDAQFWIFTTSHATRGLGVTHGLPIWRVNDDGTLAVHNSHPPTVALLEYAAALFVGPVPAAARWPALLFSLGMLAVMYALLRRAFPKMAACLGVVGLVAQPMFFHFATCPEVFLLGHLPLLALLFYGTTSNAAAVWWHRPAVLAGLAALCVAISYATLGVMALWVLAWTVTRRNRAAWLDAAAVLGGAVLALSLLLLWLHLGGGSVSHWAERGLLRSLGSQPDRPDLAADPVVTWSALMDHQVTWFFKGAGWLAWLGLIGLGLVIAGLFRKEDSAAASTPPAADSMVPGAPSAVLEASADTKAAPPSRTPRTLQLELLIAFALMFLCEACLIRQNAFTHAYSVASGGFLIAFGLAAIGEQGARGFQAIGQRRRMQTHQLIGIILSIATLGAIYRLTDVLDEQVALTSQNDMTAMATAIDKAQSEHPHQPVLVYDTWLLPAQTVTGTDLPANQGYIFPWFYRGRAFLCYRQPDRNAGASESAARPGVILWPAKVPLSPTVQAELQQQGFHELTLGGVSIYTLPTAAP